MNERVCISVFSLLGNLCIDSVSTNVRKVFKEFYLIDLLNLVFKNVRLYLGWYRCLIRFPPLVLL